LAPARRESFVAKAAHPIEVSEDRVMESSKSGFPINRSGAGKDPEFGIVPPEVHRSNIRVWSIALAGGLAAALISGLGSEWAHDAFKPQLFKVTIAFTTYIQPTADSLNVADRKNATLVFTILGGVTGLVMGLAGGLVGRSAWRSVLAGLAGLVIGAGSGGVAALALVPLFYLRVVPDPNDLLSPILIQGAIWIAIGAVGGLAFGIGVGGWKRLPDSVGGACVGALVASLVFHVLATVLFPDSGSVGPVPTSALARLLAAFLISVAIACGSTKGALGRDRPSRTPVMYQ
jgi:hypothetical protein